MTARLKRLIHVGCRELGLDADTRHDLQLQVTGKASLSEMSEPELLKVVDHLKGQGFKPSGGAKKRSGRAKAKRADVRLIHVLWKKLGDKGALREPGRDGLNRFIRARFGDAWGSVPADVDMLTEFEQIDAVIQALTRWGKASNIDFDWSAHQR